MTTSRLVMSFALVGLLCVTGCKRKHDAAPADTTNTVSTTNMVTTTNTVSTADTTTAPDTNTLKAAGDSGDNHNTDPTVDAASTPARSN